MTKIVVVGSINMDVVNIVERHPIPGETINGLGTEYSQGGKGANQAVAASLSGGEVTMIGAVGMDSFATKLVSSLRNFRVNTKSVLEKKGNSGMAFITVDAAGENNIILSAGSNGKLSKEDIDAQMAVFEQAQAVLIQNEIPWKTTQYVIEQANRQGIKVYFNPAPAVQVSDNLLPLINVMVLNESEAKVITGMEVSDEKQAEKAARHLLAKGVESVVVTLGKKGSLYIDKQDLLLHISAFNVTSVDTTAAGDTFIGALAVAQESEKSIEEALKFASAAAAITITRKGAQGSIPARVEIEKFLKNQS